MSQVLYRKYRPTRLQDVVGQEHITKVLDNAIKQNKIGHAYLFIGPRGTGKTSVARIFAHAVNGFDYEIEDHYLDIIEIDAASNTGVDNIRELREKAVIAPTEGKYKVYIIDEVHMLTKSASNALLKTLEEPPEHVIFIMATTDAYKVPITISSRTQVHTFRLASLETMQIHLRKIADLEKINISDDALAVVVRRGGGSFRDSLSLLDQITTLTNKRITAELLNSALGLPQDQSMINLLQAFTCQDFGSIHLILKELLNSGLKPEVLASEMINKIISDPDPKLLPLLEKLPDVQAPFAEAKLLLALLKPTQAENSVQHTTAHPTVVEQPKLATQSMPTEAKPRSSTKAPSTKSKSTKINVPDEPREETITEPKSQTVNINSKPFAWDDFVINVRNESGAVYNQLLKVEHDFDGATLHIFPSQKFTKSILEKPANNQLLTKYLSGIALVIHDVNDHLAAEDQTISQISAIMGGVQEVKGEMPF